MKILGNRVLVSKLEEEQTDGFQTVQVQDSFVYKGKIEQLGEGKWYENDPANEGKIPMILSKNDLILFAKHSPDTQEITHEGQIMKIININDILAVL